jgi:hypothetical protein
VVAEDRARELAADRRATHARHDDPARAVPRLEAGGLDLPERVAQVLRDGEDVGELVGGVDARDGLAVERQALGG